MVQYITLIFLFVTAFIINPFSPLVFEPPKVFVIQISIELLLLWYLFFGFEKWHARPHKLLYGLAGLFFLSLLQLALTGSIGALVQYPLRLQGMFMLWHFLFFVWMVSLFHTKIPKLWLYGALLLQIGFMLYFGRGEAGGFGGSFGTGEGLAAFAVFIYPLLFEVNTSKILKVVGMLTALILIVFSGSQVALAAFLVQTLMYILITYFRFSFKRATTVSLVALGCVMFLVLLSPSTGHITRSLWSAAAISGFNSPLIGVGFGQIKETIISTSLIQSDGMKPLLVESSNNLLLDFWIQSGLIGMGLFLWLVVSTFQEFIREKNTELTMCFLGICTMLLYAPASVWTLLAFWWLIGRGHYFFVNKKE